MTISSYSTFIFWYPTQMPILLKNDIRGNSPSDLRTLVTYKLNEFTERNAQKYKSNQLQNTISIKWIPLRSSNATNSQRTVTVLSYLDILLKSLIYYEKLLQLIQPTNLTTKLNTNYSKSTNHIRSSINWSNYRTLIQLDP